MGKDQEEENLVIPSPNLQGYFYDAVHEVAGKQGFEASEAVFAYLINLLSLNARIEVSGDVLPAKRQSYKTMVHLLQKAVDSSSRTEAAHELKYMGDAAIFIGGYFYQALASRLVDVDYYINMGRGAYASAAGYYKDMRGPTKFLSDLFREIAEKTPQIVDVLHEVGSRQGNTQQDALRLYEVFLKTHSRWASRLLSERGILPVANAQPKDTNELIWH